MIFPSKSASPILSSLSTVKHSVDKVISEYKKFIIFLPFLSITPHLEFLETAI